MDRAHLLDARAAACSDGLDALSLGVAEQTQRIRRKRRAPAIVPKDLADPAQVLCQSALPALVEECLHLYWWIGDTIRNSVPLYRSHRAHPGMDAALVLYPAARRGRDGQAAARGYDRASHGAGHALRRGVRVSRERVEERHEAPPELVDLREGVGLATAVDREDLPAGLHVEPVVLELPLLSSLRR